MINELRNYLNGKINIILNNSIDQSCVKITLDDINEILKSSIDFCSLEATSFSYNNYLKQWECSFKINGKIKDERKSYHIPKEFVERMKNKKKK